MLARHLARITKAATRELALAPGKTRLGARQVGGPARRHLTRVPRCMIADDVVARLEPDHRLDVRDRRPPAPVFHITP